MKLGDIYLGVSKKLTKLDNEYTWHWEYTSSPYYDLDLYTADGTSLIDGKKHKVYFPDRYEMYDEGDVPVELASAADVFRARDISDDEIDDDLFVELRTFVMKGGLEHKLYSDKAQEFGNYLKQQIALRKSAQTENSKKTKKSKTAEEKSSFFKKIAAKVRRKKEEEKSNDDIFSV